MHNILPTYSGYSGHMALRPQLWIYMKTQIQLPLKIFYVDFLPTGHLKLKSGLIQKFGKI